MALRCLNHKCRKVLNRRDFEVMEDDDGVLCLDCSKLPYPLSKVVSSSDLTQLMSIGSEW